MEKKPELDNALKRSPGLYASELTILDIIVAFP
jgi:hypothetical protein